MTKFKTESRLLVSCTCFSLLRYIHKQLIVSLELFFRRTHANYAHAWYVCMYIRIDNAVHVICIAWRACELLRFSLTLFFLFAPPHLQKNRRRKRKRERETAALIFMSRARLTEFKCILNPNGFFRLHLIPLRFFDDHDQSDSAIELVNCARGRIQYKYMYVLQAESVTYIYLYANESLSLSLSLRRRGVRWVAKTGWLRASFCGGVVGMYLW